MPILEKLPDKTYRLTEQQRKAMAATKKQPAKHTDGPMNPCEARVIPTTATTTAQAPMWRSPKQSVKLPAIKYHWRRAWRQVMQRLCPRASRSTIPQSMHQSTDILSRTVHRIDFVPSPGVRAAKAACTWTQKGKPPPPPLIGRCPTAPAPPRTEPCSDPSESMSRRRGIEHKRCHNRLITLTGFPANS